MDDWQGVAANLETLSRTPPIKTMNTLHVKVTWDAEASVWYVSDSNVPGLSTEAPTVEAMMEKLNVMVPELLAENGVVCREDIPFELLAERHAVTHPVIC